MMIIPPPRLTVVPFVGRFFTRTFVAIEVAMRFREIAGKIGYITDTRVIAHDEGRQNLLLLHIELSLS